MDSPILKAQKRAITGNQVKKLRRDGLLPGVVYGHGVEAQSLQIPQSEYEKAYKTVGTSTLVDLVIDDAKPVKVLLHEPDIHPTKMRPVHADFYAVRMSEKLQTEIPLHFIGEADAVTVLDGTLTTPLDALNVECYPDKLVPAIEVDISSLKTLEDVIRLEDIKLPEGIEALHEPDEVVVIITPPRSEEELAELEEAPTGEEADAAAVEGVEVTEEKPEEEATEE